MLQPTIFIYKYTINLLYTPINFRKLYYSIMCEKHSAHFYKLFRIVAILLELFNFG